jgi:hypothetical protein
MTMIERCAAAAYHHVSTGRWDEATDQIRGVFRAEVRADFQAMRQHSPALAELIDAALAETDA